MIFFEKKLESDWKTEREDDKNTGKSCLSRKKKVSGEKEEEEEEKANSESNCELERELWPGARLLQVTDKAFLYLNALVTTIVFTRYLAELLS